MFKIVAYCTLAVVAVFTTTFLAAYVPYAVESLEPTELIYEGQELFAPKNATRRLHYLDKLVDMPLVGRFFIAEKVSQLVSLNKFSDSIYWAKQALSDPLNARSFPIWYHKALSECILKQYSECESSLTWASLYSRQQYEHYMQGVYRFLEIARNKDEKRKMASGSSIERRVGSPTVSELQQL